MRKDTRTDRYQLTQKEEAWVIRAMITIEKTLNPDKEETYVLDTMNKTLFINEADLFIDTFEKFLAIAQRYEIEDKPSSMTGFTDCRRYTGVGNGAHYPLYKFGEEQFEKRRKARQDKREAVYDKVALSYEQYDDILEHNVLLREIHELKAEVARLRANQAVVIDPSVTQPTEHSFADIEQFARKQHSARIIEIRRRIKLTHDFDMACGIN